jgi:peptide/nickel transport system ATP-binding protein
MALLSVDRLFVRFRKHDEIVHAVNGVSFEVERGETLGIVGESGCGKSVTSLAIMRLLAKPAGRIEGGQVQFDGRDLLSCSEAEMRGLRGRDLAMIFQDPMTNLNPVLTIEEQLVETIRAHARVTKSAARKRAVELLTMVGIPEPATRLTDFPHQFSGGMCQRVMIAMALALEPKLLIADEPTTALDVTIQAQVLELLRRLTADRGTAMMLITHDLGVVAQMTQRVSVMYAGYVVETGATVDVFARPSHPYTVGLLHSIPQLDSAGSGELVPIEGTPPDQRQPPVGCPFAPRCAWRIARCAAENPSLASIESGKRAVAHQIACFNPPTAPEAKAGRPLGAELSGAAPRKALQSAPARPAVEINPPPADPAAPLVSVERLKVYFPIRKGVILERPVGDVRAVDDVSFSIDRQETLGLVGESGCGKSTTGRAVMRLHDPTAGSIRFEGIDLASLGGKALRRMRRHMQMIFQDPFASLNPRMTVGTIIAEPLEVHETGMSAAERRERVDELLTLVGLDSGFGGRYPHEFSGGQRQRVGIARALALNPGLVVADEPVSALDVSIQAQILNLLQRLQDRLGVSYLLIAHDLAVVGHVSQRTAVMYLGRIVEMAGSRELRRRPLHPYSVALLSAAPIPDPEAERRRQRIILAGDVPSPVNPPAGCRFHTRCWLRKRLGDPERCVGEDPVLQESSPGHGVACHFADKVDASREQLQAVGNDP